VLVFGAFGEARAGVQRISMPAFRVAVACCFFLTPFDMLFRSPGQTPRKAMPKAD